MYLNCKTVLKAIDYRVAVFPLLLTLLITMLVLFGLYAPGKQILEDLGIIILGGFSILLIAIYIRNRSFVSMWSTGIVLVLLAREIHFYGTENGVYVLLLVMWLVAMKYFDKLRGYLLCPAVASLLFAGFFTYFIAVSVDQRWWFWIPGEKIFHLPLEETLELFGHLLIGGTLLVAPVLVGKVKNIDRIQEP